MKSNLLKYTLSFGFFVFLIACSVKKDKFINRNFHAVTTEYNVLYNGNIALDQGLVELKTTYQDNFWEILPIERMPNNEEALLPDQTKNANFERAEEKAVKAIQKHSMNINGTERNPQMDEAYLLLAKARYYDNRFVPSLEALNYILYKHPSSDKIYHAKVWREKVNIRLDNDEVAIKNLKKLLQNKNVAGRDLADANAMLTQAYMNIEAQDSAVATLKIAKQTTENSEEKARYAFILGQLYENLNHQDSAFATYEDVIQMNRKSPRRYVIQAHAKQAQQFDFIKGDTAVFVKKFQKMLNDRENRPYLDVLNHQMALFYDKQNKSMLAEHYYNKSIKAVSTDNYLVASNYRNIGEIKFKEAKYSIAGKYYDSTLVRLSDRTREYRKIKKKRINLVDVIKYETIATQNDSILSVVAMNESQRNTYYENYISKLKLEDAKKAKLAAELAQKEANLLANQNASQGGANQGINPNAFSSKDMSVAGKSSINPVSMPLGMNNSDEVANFYFYNPVTVQFGIKEFVSKWGKRELKDNWRWSAMKTGITAIDIANDENTDDLVADEEKDDVAVNPLYEVDFYLKQIPSDDKFLDSLAIDRNFAYYQLGLIYKEKFKEYELAASRLEQLLKNNPEARLILPAKYNLFKIYQIISPAKAEIMKQQILAEYPNSRYAEIVRNPSVAIEDDTNPEAVYNATFKRFENNQIREVAQEIDDLINRFTGEESVAKFEMLKARIAARLQGLDQYKKGLNFVALSYPNIEEGKAAEKLLQDDIPKLEALIFTEEEEASEWKIIFPKKFPLDKDVKNLTDKIEKYLKDSNTVLLKSSDDIYNMDNNFIVIHGFSSRERANSVLSLLREYKDYKIKDQAYIISTKDYKIVQMKKKFEEWILLNQ